MLMNVIEYFAGLIKHPFVMRALIIGPFISVCAAILGVVLVLKKLSLIGHALGDVGFAALSAAIALGVNPLAVSVPVSVAASILIMYLAEKNAKDRGDAVIGIVATFSLAVGIIITALGNGFNMDVMGFMFGSILALQKSDVWLCVIFSIFVIAVFCLLYNRIFLIACDENYAKTCGINVGFYKFLISFLAAVTVVIGMRMMGTMLISSLIIFPAMTANNFSASFKGIVIMASVCAAACFFVGIFFSLLFNLPSGASIVVVNVILLSASYLVKKIKRGVA